MVLPHRTKIHTQQPEVSAVTVQHQIPEQTAPKVPRKITAADEQIVQLQAKSALALDLNTGTDLYAVNIQERLPIASLTKLMTAMVVADKVNKDLLVTIMPEDVNVVGSKMDLVAGEKITVENLLYGLLIPSSNDAAQALARFVGGSQDNFVAMMNDKAQELGLTSTHFSNPVGLDSPDNYSTALDLANETKEFMKYSLLAKIVDTKEMIVSSADGKIVHNLKTSNKLLLENPEVVGVKTGFTSEAQGNLILKLKHGDAEILTVVLNSADREGDSQKLLDWITQNYTWN